jgi:hypothetical protein
MARKTKAEKDVTQKKADRKEKRLARKAAREADPNSNNKKTAKKGRSKKDSKVASFEKDALLLEAVAAKLRNIGKALSEL